MTGDRRETGRTSRCAVLTTVPSTWWPVRPGSGPLDHPVHYIGLPELGSLVLEFDPDRIDVRFVDVSGTPLDSFAVVQAVFHDGFETGDTSAWSSSVP